MLYNVVMYIVYVVEMLISYIFFSRLGEKKTKPSYCWLIGISLFSTGFLVNYIFANKRSFDWGCYFVCGLYSITQEIGKIETEIAGNIISKENGTAIIEGLLGQATTGQMLGLSASMTLIPVILFIVEYIIIKKKYIITEEFYEKIVKEIAMRKEESNA